MSHEHLEPRYRVCESFYDNGKGCGKCPIRSECTSWPPWGHEGLSMWRDKCNEAAQKHIDNSKQGTS